jgi:DNA primase
MLRQCGRKPTRLATVTARLKPVMSNISEVKERIDIVALISEYVQLQKAGKNYKGLCPFHSEKHGSFFVFPDRQTWHCFGACATGGDIFSFIMKKENVDFGEALRMLADRAGVQLERTKPFEEPRDEATDRLLALVDLAATHYREILLRGESARHAREYLASRKIDFAGPIGEAFRLGYAPSGWTDTQDMLAARGYSGQELIDVGLVVEKDAGGTYDRFRDRVMFPIFNSMGVVIGFGGRAIGDVQPKYMNSPQSRLFDKGAELYGIHMARSAARRADRIILVEGYMDVLQAHQHGWDNVVAPMGTSLTERQASHLSRITKNVYLALDADEAGMAAAMKTIRETTGRFRDAFGHRTTVDMGPKGGRSFRSVLDANIRIILMPPGRDPDEVVSESPEQWNELVEHAIPYVDFYVDTLVTTMDTETAQGKRELIAACQPIIAELEDGMDRARFHSRLSRAMEIPERELRAELSSLERRSSTNGDKKPQAVDSGASRNRSATLEEYCLRLLISNPDLRPLAGELDASHFETTENRQVYETWSKSSDLASLRSELDVSLAEHLDFLLSEPSPPGIPSDAETQRLALTECILRLRERLAKRQHFMRENRLAREREEDGVAAELETLDEIGVAPNQRLQQIFVEKSHKGRTKRG